MKNILNLKIEKSVGGILSETRYVFKIDVQMTYRQCKNIYSVLNAIDNFLDLNNRFIRYQTINKHYNESIKKKQLRKIHFICELRFPPSTHLDSNLSMELSSYLSIYNCFFKDIDHIQDRTIKLNYWKVIEPLHDLIVYKCNTEPPFMKFIEDIKEELL